MEISIQINKSNDESKLNGVSPYLSAEDLHYSISRSRKEFIVNKIVTYDSMSSFYTCNSSIPTSSSNESNNNSSEYTTATSSEIESRVSV